MARYTGQSLLCHLKWCCVNGNNRMLQSWSPFAISSVLQILIKCLLPPCDGLQERDVVEVVEIGPFFGPPKPWTRFSRLGNFPNFCSLGKPFIRFSSLAFQFWYRLDFEEEASESLRHHGSGGSSEFQSSRGREPFKCPTPSCWR